MHGPLRECLLNVRHRVCGYRLRPLCFDHIEAMQAVGLPFPFRRAEVTSGELIAAARICSMSGTQLEQDLPKPTPSPRDWITAIRHVSVKQLQADIAAFTAYMSDFAALPEVMDQVNSEDGAVHESSMPRVPGLFARLTMVLIAYKGSISEERARSMPIGLLMHYAELAAFHNGKGRPFMDHEALAELDADLDAADAAGADLMKRTTQQEAA
jgi:hypothetical protein